MPFPNRSSPEHFEKYADLPPGEHLDNPKRNNKVFSTLNDKAGDIQRQMKTTLILLLAAGAVNFSCSRTALADPTNQTR